MQSLSGRIQPALLDQQKFVLLPGYERGGAQSAASHSLKKPSFLSGHFGSLPSSCRILPPSCWSQNGASFAPRWEKP